MKKCSATVAIFLLMITSYSLSHAAGWREISPGLLVDRPDVRLSSNDTHLSGAVELKPGSGIIYELGIKPGEKGLTGIEFTFQSDGCNIKSLDYKEGDSRFLVSTTVVFGEDRQDIGWRKRTALFFGHLWNGFPPKGIRLTYAWGCGAPVGSMFRITDEETVFVVAGKEEAGRRIESKRIASSDFQAAYGRLPKGPVTALMLRLDRPSNEKENVNLSFDLKPAGYFP